MNLKQTRLESKELGYVGPKWKLIAFRGAFLNVGRELERAIEISKIVKSGLRYISRLDSEFHSRTIPPA